MEKRVRVASVTRVARACDGMASAVGVGGAAIMYIFSELLAGSSSLDEIFFSAARTTPSVPRIPMAVPACEIASIAYST